MNRQIIFAAILFICSASLIADVLPEGKKPVRYSFELTNIDSYSGYTYIAFPVNNSNGAPNITAEVLSQGLSISPSCKYSTPQFYAVKNEDFNKALFDSLNSIKESSFRSVKLKEFITSGKFIPSIQIQCEAFADRDAKYYYIHEQFKVESMTGGTVVIKSQKIIYKDGNNNVIDAKDSKSMKDDVVTPKAEVGSYILIIIPVLALVALVSVFVIRKMRK
jgi:hypothetical protein